MIRAVLDTTAVLAWADDSYDVVEFLAELADEDVDYAIPALCLAEAARDVSVKGLELLDGLAAGGVVLPLEDWRPLGVAARVWGSVSRATVAAISTAHGAYVVTREPGVYAELPTVEI